ncbi:hypothetical protein AKJ37_01875 [candidate division MSBL1 archaeon SCGC-AAA259I09]|uniref:ABC transporter domain-containing protein n=2 Tax=candidate division MSBL1 TaxID=215777 RepID=A0A133UUR1_9EURY|nr:hypothetical protein AKJ61_00525 [candidate division MSBL1 archaeon SCGC-AAA259B11]KXA97941.1 hypothetical protein AKJ37_01875 [candidate division MSBL1 archaeon SCGC-AAA259I09]
MLLEVENVKSGYGEREILHGISLSLEEEEICTIIGPNGSGKSTFLKTVMGYLIPFEGSIRFKGKEIKNLRPDERVKMGIGYVPQLENIFPTINIEDTLLLGAYLNEEIKEEQLERVYEIFPVLSDYKNREAGTLSGGESQMLAIGRALMSRPDLLILDEPSAALAPKFVENVFEKIKEINRLEETAMLIVEQNAYKALELSNRGYVFAQGQKQFSGPADEILEREDLKEAYLGG